MNKILIATRNKDKYQIVSTLLKTSIFNNYTFYCLEDLKEKIIERKETGNIINRSFEKAENIFKSIKDNDFDYIIGVDDGIKIKGEIYENVKDYVGPIINDELLSQNEHVSIVRAYTFFNQKGNYYSILTEIPFKYKKLGHPFMIKENTFPLSYVFTPVNSDIPFSSQSFDESIKYYLSYSIDKYKEIIDNFNER